MTFKLFATFAMAAALLLIPHISRAATSDTSHCASRSDQPNTKAEILKIEHAWSQAYWTGHTGYLECLYAPNFVSINSHGKPHDRAHDIAGSKKYIGKSYTPSDKWVIRVLMYPDYAIATSVNSHAIHGLRVTDIYAYDGHHWHAIFSQDTKF